MKRERPTQKRIDELKAEVDELREALRELLFLKQLADADMVYSLRDFRVRTEKAWRTARDLIGGEG
jgi:hypothetical protein